MPIRQIVQGQKSEQIAHLKVPTFKLKCPPPPPVRVYTCFVPRVPTFRWLAVQNTCKMEIYSAPWFKFKRTFPFFPFFFFFAYDLRCLKSFLTCSLLDTWRRTNSHTNVDGQSCRFGHRISTLSEFTKLVNKFFFVCKLVSKFLVHFYFVTMFMIF